MKTIIFALEYALINYVIARWVKERKNEYKSIIGLSSKHTVYWKNKWAVQYDTLYPELDITEFYMLIIK